MHQHVMYVQQTPTPGPYGSGIPGVNTFNPIKIGPYTPPAEEEEEEEVAVETVVPETEGVRTYQEPRGEDETEEETEERLRKYKVWLEKQIGFEDNDEE